MALPSNPAWKALFEYVANTPDAFSNHENVQLDPERKKWLEAAINGSVIDENKHVQNLLDAITRPDLDEETTLQYLDALLTSIERLDIANNLHKYDPDGWLPLLHVMRSHDSTPATRAAAAQVISAAVQNNPVAQAEAMKRDVLAAAAECVTNKDPGVCSAGISVLSTMTRANPGILAQTIESEVLQNCLSVAMNTVINEPLDSNQHFRLALRVVFYLSVTLSQLKDDLRAKMISSNQPMREMICRLSNKIIDHARSKLEDFDGRVMDLAEKTLTMLQQLPRQDLDLCGTTACLSRLDGALQEVSEDAGLMADENDAASVNEMMTLVKGLMRS
ncbi:hypothetical protein J8273_7092 [Carpediemonas membranifera]|uniref:Nucleotide exchange factor Fes1 domain-containing protein n=1 Tax=Carpediemonas membranifera TaxID=201153 RepID=A0A8J6DZK1_9EUKA|nr:hypothetical protein J8273_7092 [Carpediemonas membranifera]|eukprot:KAG9390833.1 hypothetical protein J8273_7092 [Carpediemonas membranifera]